MINKRLKRGHKQINFCLKTTAKIKINKKKYDANVISRLSVVSFVNNMKNNKDIIEPNKIFIKYTYILFRNTNSCNKILIMK